jgi:hypothetical protein
MRTIAKAGLGALALASFGVIAAAPANAASSFGFSLGTGPVYGGYYDPYYDSPCYRPYPYRPYYCDRSYTPGFVYSYGYAPRPYYGGYYGNRYRDRDWDRDRDRDHGRRR